MVILDNWKSDRPKETVLLAGKLPPGCAMHPDLSFDAKRALFGFCDHAGKADRRHRGFVICEVTLDGGEVRRLAETPLRRELMVRAECPGLLVFSELFYPGWEARVDGRPVPLRRANVAFSALWLEAGEHRIERRYVPRIFHLGLAISLATLGLVVVWARRC